MGGWNAETFMVGSGEVERSGDETRRRARSKRRRRLYLKILSFREPIFGLVSHAHL